jgi:hypothetical protein
VKDSEWWDRAYKVMDMAMLEGNWPIYMNDDTCPECGSNFEDHRCHMEGEQ